jgi:serine/threonine protein kinase
MGVVYLAIDCRLDRKLALKVMLPRFAANAAAKERFLREARAAAKISHDNVVIVHEADEREGVPYIAMQLLQGYPLDEYLKTKGAPPLPHVIRIAREAALGLAAAHALALVHRDIKPANLWLEAPNGRVKVLDFGLAKPIDSEAELTDSGAVVGTPAYMSPEQARGEKVDSRTDLFGLGAVLYRLCTGKTPFAGPNVMAVLMKLASEEPAAVRELNPTVPEALALLVHQLLSKKPEDRPPSATEVARRLRAILEEVLPQHAVHAGSPMPLAVPVDVLSSQPVVVHVLPTQPPVVVPMQITAQPESAFANLGEDDLGATEVEPAASTVKQTRKQSGGKGMWVLMGIAVVLAVVAAATVILQIDKKKEPEAKGPDGGTPGDRPEPKVGPEQEKSLGSLPRTYKNNLGMEFTLVPSGTGWLGGEVAHLA